MSLSPVQGGETWTDRASTRPAGASAAARSSAPGIVRPSQPQANSPTAATVRGMVMPSRRQVAFQDRQEATLSTASPAPARLMMTTSSEACSITADCQPPCSGSIWTSVIPPKQAPKRT